jgi:hypothetical protein
MSKLALIALVALAGCPEDGATNNTRERITQAAYNQVCSMAEEFLVSQYSGNYYVQALCTAHAVENSDSAEMCGNTLDNCINNPPPEVQSGIDGILAQGGCGAINIEVASCTSTVRALEDCLDALSDELSSLEYTLTCASFGQDLDGWNLVELPEKCRSLESDC